MYTIYCIKIKIQTFKQWQILVMYCPKEFNKSTRALLFPVYKKINCSIKVCVFIVKIYFSTLHYVTIILDLDFCYADLLF